MFAVSFYPARISNEEAKVGKQKKCQLCGDCICISNLIWASKEFENETPNSFHFSHFIFITGCSWGRDSFWMKLHQSNCIKVESSCYWKSVFENGPELLQSSCYAQGVMKHVQCGFQALSNESSALAACFYHTTEAVNIDISSYFQC